MAGLSSPRAPQELSTLQQPRKPPPMVAESLAVLEGEIGGRDALVAALSHAPKSRDLIYLLGLIGDPREATTHLADLCAKGGITAGELIDAYKSGEINRAQAVATARVGAQLAAVAEDTMRRSLRHVLTCDACQGRSLQPPCETCGGTGVLVQEGDLEHKKLALEMGKMLQKGGGMQVNVNQQVGVQVGTAGGALERMMAATDQILYGDTPADTPLEAEFAEAEEVEDVEEVEEEVAGESDQQSSPGIDPDTPIEEGDWREDLSP